MEKIAAEVRELVSTADDAGRRELLKSLRELQYSLETPDDTLKRMIHYNLRLTVARTATDLKLFSLLAQNAPSPMTTIEIAKQTGAAEVLLGRLLRYLASLSMIKETGVDTFTANNITTALAGEGFQAGLRVYFDSHGPTFQAAPAFLAETHYSDITDHTKTPFQAAYNTDLPAFTYATQFPVISANFNNYLAYERTGRAIWLDAYPLEEECKAQPAEDVLLVDIGGGIGDQCVALKTRFPDIPGRVILQDEAHVLANAIVKEGVEEMAQDFFQPQAVKYAKYYYLRNILHDWPDASCRLILENTKAAMGPHSMLLIDDIVLPNSGVHWQAAQLDMTMMFVLGAMERTREQWRALLDSVSMKMVKVVQYTSLGDSIIVAVGK
ncbi:S-adenosyl-L-methionine-dependent methyltransferase [Lepidopterella palustris CBS 459.81]|uniref:S-adenosyl-L-methionine-dependent methyltransferase n=1 Tax=Lepidopterella palustris CBS 459.81 TaxID=1314670 RepID=A0A8E2EJA2_9PEZI|nr:S-adenosyl-L-methionine-dependent methyltransferase [Lepidopterella palustris CBS 459.81]